MPLFCLPAPKNQARADPKVDKKWDECPFFVYLTLKIRPVRILKQNKISKIWKNVLPQRQNSNRAGKKLKHHGERC